MSFLAVPGPNTITRPYRGLSVQVRAALRAICGVPRVGQPAGEMPAETSAKAAEAP